MQQPPIGASIKLALSATLGVCNKDDVPRSRVNGFDYDGASRTISPQTVRPVLLVQLLELAPNA